MRAKEFLKEDFNLPPLRPNMFGVRQPPERFTQAGLTLYHGTDWRYLPDIFRNGLRPRTNEHEVNMIRQAVVANRGKPEAANMDTKPSPPAIFTAPSLNHLEGYPFNLVMKFVTTDSDQLGRAQYHEDEVLVYNVISPDRLEFVKGDRAKWDAAKEKAAGHLDLSSAVSDAVKIINSKIKPLGWSIKKTSAKTDRVQLYGPEHKVTYQPTPDTRYDLFNLKKDGAGIFAKYKLPWDDSWINY